MRTSGVVVCVVGSACSFTAGSLVDARIDGDAEGWSTPVEVAELSDPAGNDDPSLTADLLEIYFGSRRTGGMSGAEDIWVARRASVEAPFGTPENVAALNSIAGETTAKVSADGLTIFFASNRASATFDVYYSTRQDRDASWSLPIWLPDLSSGLDDLAAFPQPNLLRLVMCRATAAMVETIYESARPSTSHAWGAPTNLTDVDALDYSECDPIEPHSRALYYSSDNRNADRTHDIYRASRPTATGPWGSRTAVTEINMPGFDERDPWVSADERTMVFTSNRNGVIDQLYITTR